MAYLYRGVADEIKAGKPLTPKQQSASQAFA
jgi:hypothetical protein